MKRGSQTYTPSEGTSRSEPGQGVTGAGAGEASEAGRRGEEEAVRVASHQDEWQGGGRRREERNSVWLEVEPGGEEEDCSSRWRSRSSQE